MVTEGIIRATAGTSGGDAAAVVDDDLGEEGMQCIKHPYRNTASNGGICPLCLQDKLGKLVSSASSSLFNVAGSSSSSSPSFRSDPCSTANAASLSLTLALRPAARPQDHSTCSSTNQTTTRRTLIPFHFPHRKNKTTAPNLVLKRSKSAVAPRRQHSSVADDYVNPAQKNRGGFWSFLYYSKPKRAEKASSSSSSSARDLKPAPQQPPTTKRADHLVVVDESVDSPSSGSSNATSSFGRKVSRSRSVGCGSRSFSGDFFERISTGFGDCTLRRVESQREGKRRSSGDVIKEKVRCAGIFSGFMMTSSSSSSSSSYPLSAGEEQQHVNGKGSTSTAAPSVVNGRSKSWRWALASPMRAFGKQPSPSSSTKELKPAANKSNATPKLSAIPSLLTARG